MEYRELHIDPEILDAMRSDEYQREISFNSEDGNSTLGTIFMEMHNGKYSSQL